MAIRFCCAQCGQPIEVDDEHAGRTAACPYCRHVMSVPQESTYQAEAAVPARTLSGGGRQPEGIGPLPEPPAIHAPPGRPTAEAKQRSARVYGSYALVCTALALALFCIGGVRAAMLYVQSGKMTGGSPPTPAEIADLQQRAAQDPWVVGPQYGAIFFALVGVVLAIVSLTQGISGNWRGLTAGIICGLFFLCLCTGVVFSLLTGFGRLPSA